MAYKMTMKVYGASQQATIYADFVTFIQSIGWTLHHDINASTKVFTTVGESGNTIQEYLWTQVSGTSISLRGYLYWDAVGGSGLGANGSAAAHVFSTAGAIYMFGNKNYVFLGYPGSVTFVECLADLSIRLITKPSAVINGALTAGSNVVASVSDTEGFIVNNYYQIVDNKTGIRTSPQVIAVNPGVSITFGVLSYNISDGAIVGQRPSIFCTTYTSSSTRTYLPTCPLGTEGSGVAATTQTSISAFTTAAQDIATSLYRLPRIMVSNSSATTGIMGLLDEEFRLPPVTTLGTLFPVSDSHDFLIAAATGGGNDYLDNAGASWAVDEHKGKILVIAGGTGSDQTRYIISNTATRLTVGQVWITNPNATSLYLIADRVYRVIKSNTSNLIAALEIIGAP
jgi:hypothetical protein